MHSATKLVAWIIGIALLVIVGAGGALLLFFDPNDYKPEIIALVKERTGRELSIPGKISLAVFPWLGVKLGEAQLSNAPGFGDQPFAALQSAQLRVKLLPLLKKRVELDTVSLHGLTLNLARSKSGKTNWDDLIAKGQDKKQESPLAKLSALAIGGVDVRDAAIIWDDKSSGARHTISQLTLRTGALADKKPFDITLEFGLESAPLRGRVALDGEGRIDLAAARYQLMDAKINIEIERGKERLAELSARLDAALPEQTLTLLDIKLASHDVTASGTLKGEKLLDAPVFSGALKVAEFSPRELMNKLGIKPPQTADSSVLTRAALETQVAATAQRVNFNKLALRLDDTTATGSMNISNFSAPLTGFKLALNELDLDRYLPPANDEGKARAVTPAGAAAAGAGMFPVETLRKLNLNGELRLAGLKAKNLHLSDISITLSARDGDIRVPVSARLYEGKYNGATYLDVRGRTPLLTLEESLQGVQAGPLLKDMFGKERITGKVVMDARLTLRGTTSAEMKQTLSGKSAFSFTDGAVKGVNIAKLLREAQAMLKGGAAAPPGGEPNQTDFSELSGTVTLVNGVARNEDLSANPPLLRVTGRGSADLVGERMDYLASATVVASLEGQGGKGLEQLKGLTVPIRISGPFSNLSYRPDVEAIVKGKVQEKLEQKQQDLQQKLQEKLRNLFQ
ncbi:MAG: AsmA family protein [Gammaproteobacteria bacterium]|nr:AsmA family protein [Gammaproteobacteria bacterium]